ncbi:hypothetical protein PCI56_27990 [Plesiomonas shigelloides subsp. oncorhynchi]|nr:hypothetical protein [Plesiomonas shigelloides]
MTDHLKETKYRIDCALDELEHFLTENPLQALWLYELPQWKRDDEGTLPDTIPVTEIHGGNELTPLLMKIYRQFYAPEPEEGMMNLRPKSCSAIPALPSAPFT